MADTTSTSKPEKQPASEFVHLLPNSLYLGDAWVEANRPKDPDGKWGTVKVGKVDREAPNGFVVVDRGEVMSNEPWRGKDGTPPFASDPHPDLVTLGRAAPAAPTA